MQSFIVRLHDPQASTEDILLLLNVRLPMVVNSLQKSRLLFFDLQIKYLSYFSKVHVQSQNPLLQQTGERMDSLKAQVRFL